MNPEFPSSAPENTPPQYRQQYEISLLRQYRGFLRGIVESLRSEMAQDCDWHEVMSVASVLFVRAAHRYEKEDDAEDSFETYARRSIEESLREQFGRETNFIEMAAKSTPASPELAADGAIDLANCRILVVEDSPLTRRKLRFLLQHKGYQVFEARSGEEALWLAPECRPDLILLDVMLDGINGFETCRRLKRMPSLLEVPVIFLTGKSETQDIVEGFEAGASDYIAKPFRPAEAFPRIQTHLKVRLLSDFRRQNIEQLRSLNQAKDRFLRMASHDLRNPLSAICGLTEMMAEESFGELNDEQKEILSSIGTAADGMAALLRDLLEISSLEKEKEECSFSRQSLSEVAQSVVHLAKAPARKKGIEVVMHTDGSNFEGDFDKNQIRRVLENLVSNAIKFSPFNTVVTVDLARRAETLEVRVSDAGSGVPETEQHLLFKEFSRTSVRPTNGEESTGLGLSICRKIVQSHGGEIGMENLPQGGACFSFQLPREQAAKVTARVAFEKGIPIPALMR
jgi:signal transduction histidine kinase